MRTRSKLSVFAALLVMGLLFGLLLSACGGTTTDTNAAATSGSDTTAAAATDSTAAATDTTAAAATDTSAAATGDWNGKFDGTVTIGALDSLTGDSAMGGAEQQWAQEKAVADQNAKGGVVVDGKHMEIKLKVIDDKSQATEAAAAMEKLIKVEGLKVILSTQVTPINLAAAQVAEKYQAFYQQCTSYTDTVRAQNFKWSSDIFFAPAVSSDLPFKVAQTMPESERPTKWGVLTEDNQDGQAIGDAFKANAAKEGATIVEYQTFTPGTKDFSSALLKLKQAGVDALLAFSTPADGITFTKQMKEQDFAPKLIMGFRGFWPQEYAQGLGADANYVLHDGFWSEDLPYPGAKELGQAYRDAHKGLDSVAIGEPYAAAQTLFQAITNANSMDPAKVKAAVWGQTFKGTVMGDIVYDAQGVCDIPPLALQWVDGKRVIIYPDMGNKLQWFKPWNQR